jgi:hypothetical protein
VFELLDAMLSCKLLQLFLAREKTESVVVGVGDVKHVTAYAESRTCQLVGLLLLLVQTGSTRLADSTTGPTLLPTAQPAVRLLPLSTLEPQQENISATLDSHSKPTPPTRISTAIEIRTADRILST